MFAVLKGVVTSLDRVGLEYVYVVIALLFGIGLLLLIPPFQTPDEPAHFFRAWGLAGGCTFPPRDYTETLPENVANLPNSFPIGSIGSPEPHAGFSMASVRDLLDDPISSVTVSVPTTIPSQNPLGYLPQALGIDVTRLIGWSPLGALYLARLFNLLAAVALVFLAIHLIPFGKAMLLIPAVFPVTLAQMASTSPDALCIAGAILFTALALRCSQKVFLARSDLLMLLVVAAALLSIKPGYFTLAGLLLVMPTRAFGSRSRYARWVGLILLIVLAIAALMVFSPPSPPPELAGQTGPAPKTADSMAQLRFVLHHPVAFAQVLVRTLGAQTLDLSYSMTSLLGWLSIRVSQVAMLALLGLTLILIQGRDDDPPVSARCRTVLLSTFAATLAVMLLAIYMALSPVAEGTVWGLQGRYITPLVPLLLLGLYRIRLRRGSVVVLLTVGALFVVSVATVIAVLGHYHY